MDWRTQSEPVVFILIKRRAPSSERMDRHARWGYDKSRHLSTRLTLKARLHLQDDCKRLLFFGNKCHKTMAEGERRGGGEWEGTKEEGTHKGWFTHPCPKSWKIPDCRTDLIGGGGDTDVCPGRQTLSRRNWEHLLEMSQGRQSDRKQQKNIRSVVDLSIYL